MQELGDKINEECGQELATLINLTLENFVKLYTI